MSGAEVAAEVEAACTKVSAVSIWLPEHLQRTHQSLDEARPIVARADERFRSALESLDPPDDLNAPLETLENPPDLSQKSLADAKASWKREIAAYEQIGATRCAKGLRASILATEGTSIKAAFRQEGIELPPRPPGW